jgi:hypothetical protein
MEDYNKAYYQKHKARINEYNRKYSRKYYNDVIRTKKYNLEDEKIKGCIIRHGNFKVTF